MEQLQRERQEPSTTIKNNYPQPPEVTEIQQINPLEPMDKLLILYPIKYEDYPEQNVQKEEVVERPDNVNKLIDQESEDVLITKTFQILSEKKRLKQKFVLLDELFEDKNCPLVEHVTEG